MFTFNTVTEIRQFAKEFDTPLVHATNETLQGLLDTFKNACCAFSESPFEHGREWALTLGAINDACNAAFACVAVCDASLEVVTFLIGDYMTDARVVGTTLVEGDCALFTFRDQYQMQSIMTFCKMKLTSVTYDAAFAPTFTYAQ